MICPVLFSQRFVFYGFGNTPAVSLTQDLPPEQDADILLLGCGDVRNVLFTCFADAARKIDVTCCDIEPLVLARNVLMYSLLIDDTENINIERIWNIYYDWKIDEESLELLETQAQKLLRISETIDQWHSSVYGSCIRFCDVKSLSSIRSHWMGFRLQDLSRSEKTNRLNQMQAAYDRARAWRNQLHKKDALCLSGLHPAYPIGFDAIGDLAEASDHWWDFGTSPSSTLKPTILNPALLYSPNPSLTLSCAVHPLLGIPVGTAFTPISKGSALHLERKDATSAEYLVHCAKLIFKQWASAFRKAVANKSVIRIFCGDALAFSFTLRNCQLTLPAHRKSINLPRDNWTTGLVQLYHDGYGMGENAAPLSFDIIDTSNLFDVLGPLNLIGITSSLLKYKASSCLYTEVLIQRDSNLVNRLNGLFGVDVRTMSLLLGLVAPDLFTNATDNFEEDPLINAVILDCSGQGFARSRLRWRQLQSCQESNNFPSVHINGRELAKFLVQVHKAMFRHEDLGSFPRESSAAKEFYAKSCINQYNRASFALLLNFIRATVISNWDQCVENICFDILTASHSKSLTPLYWDDLTLNLHLYGLDPGWFKKPTRADLKDAILAKILPCKNDLPEQLCVTIQVPREQLSVYTRMTPYAMGNPTIDCSFQGKDPGATWCRCFSSVQMTFGSWHERTEKNESYPYIEEDSFQQSGTSDMLVSVLVPTSMLLQSKQCVPQVKCHLIPTMQTHKIFGEEFGKELCFASYKMTSKNVFISRYMPGMSALPAFTLAKARQDKSTSTSTMVKLTEDWSKIDTIVQCVPLESQAAKAAFAVRSATVEVKFQSPLKASISIGKSEELKIKFPVPVSPIKYKITIEKKLSCVKIETPLFDPLENAASFLFPTFITETPSASVPVAWTSTRIDLDAMPTIDLTNKLAASWLVAHTGLMFSNRELTFRLINMSDPSYLGTKVDIRAHLKDGLFSIFLHYAGMRCQPAEYFGLMKPNGVIQTLIFPSCMRLDLVNHTVVLDSAIIPLTNALRNDPRAAQFVRELTENDLCQVKVCEAENRTWKAIMPALVERCRTAASWKHTSSCEYLAAGEIPLPRGLSEDGVSPICSCGVGNFPPVDYLLSQMEKLPDLNYMVSQYATRAAVAPIFTVPYVEDFEFKDLREFSKNTDFCMADELSEEIKFYGIHRGVYNDKKCIIQEKCVTCGRRKRMSSGAGEQRLLCCSRCKFVRYCSVECQKANWKQHKPFCVTACEIVVHRT